MAVEQAQKGVAFQGGQDALDLARKPQTYWSMAFTSLRRDKLTIVALSFIAVIALLALGAGVITNAIGVSPTQTNPANQFQQPYLIPYLQWMLGTDPLTAPTMLYKSGGAPHWLGTDQLGRDQLARLLYGARISLSIALVAAGLSMALGVSVGAVAGYFGGRVDDVIMWFIATLTTIPEIYLLIIVNSIFRPTPLTLTLFLGFLGWFGTARFMRGNVFKVRMLEYTTAARAVGASNYRILLRHVIPNSLPIIVVITAVDVGALILTESILSFLGLGVQPPTPTWGNMLYRANDFVFLRDPVTKEFLGLHLLIWPGVLITLTVLSFYLIGDGLRDALDPMLKNKK
ncbi:MAG: ABC transporter permease [Caldilineaceae bacterium]|jgi:peptide/nickel transport system permease protein|nr:ABC transporter permease [Caldilineaceae bacterium]